MSALSDKYYSKEEVLSIAKEKNISEKYFEEFYSFLEKDILQITNDGEFKENEIGQSAINYALEYFTKYDKEIQKGHSEEWARLYANSCEEPERAFHNAFWSIREHNPERANKEMEIHCNAVGGDELYKKHFIYLMNEAEGLNEPDKQAKLYSRIFKEQIILGKSLIFADKYANWMAENNCSESFAFAYAKAYDAATVIEKPELYAIIFANKTADYYADKYSKSKEFKYDETDLFYECKIAGYMKGWEYANTNKLNNAGKFIELFEHEYLNTYYADSGKPNLSEEELEKLIFKKILEKFNKL